MRRKLLQIAAILAALMLAGAGALPAQGEGETGDAASALTDSLAAIVIANAEASGDSLTAAAVDSLVGAILAAQAAQAEQPAIPTTSAGLHPVFRSETRALDKRVDITNEMTLSVAYPSTWVVGGDIHFNRSLPRELTREGIDTGFSLNTSRQLLPKVPLRLNAMRSFREDEQNKGESNYRRDVNELAQVGVNLSAARQLKGWLAANANTAAGASEQTVRNNQNLNRSSSNVTRTLGGHVDLLPVEGLKIVTGFSGSSVGTSAELNKISSDIETRNDSLQLKLSYRPAAMLSLGFEGGRLEKVNESLDFERNQYGLVEDSTKIVIDETRELAVGTRFNFSFKPLSRLELSGNASLQNDEKRVKLTANKDKDGEKAAFQLGGKLRPWSGADTDFSYKSSESKSVDFSSDKRSLSKELLASASQALGKTFKVTGEVNFRLDQEIYADGKQDRDKLVSRYTLIVNGLPAEWLSASSSLQWFATQDLLIPSSNSVGSKDKNILSWKADLNYTFREKYKVSQRYEVSATEEDFYFTPDKNALSEEYVLVTSSTIPLAWRIALDFEHEFRLREVGSYLPDPTVPGNPKTFFKDSRTKTEHLRLGMSYRYREYLTIACRQELSRDVDFDYDSEEYRLSPSGTLDFSMRFTQAIGAGGSLDATLHHRSKFGSFVRESQRSLWLPTLSIGYTF